MTLSRLSGLVPVLLLLAAFGPYVAGSLRVEHFILYPAAVGALFVVVLKRRLSMLLLVQALALLLLCLWAVSITVAGVRPTSVLSLFASLDNMLQPVAVLLVFMALPRACKTQKAMEWGMTLVVGLLVLNTAAILVHVMTGNGRFFTPWLPPPDALGSTVWERSLGNGRYCGIFAQPLEAGAMYSLGLFFCLYLALKRRRQAVLWVLLALVNVIGGMFSVSKIILLVGIPMAVLFLLSERYGRWVVTRPWFLVTAAAAGSVASIVVLSWSGFDYLLRLFAPQQGANLLELYTAGRFGGQTDVTGKFERIWQEAPLTGLGLASFTTVDNGYLDVFSQGGLTGLALLALVVTLLFVPLLLRVRKSLEARWAAFIVLFVLLASVGGPVLTMNRFEIVFWLVWAWTVHNLGVMAPPRERKPAHA